MKSRKSAKRLEYVYGLFAAMAVGFCVHLVPLTNSLHSANPEAADRAVMEEKREQEELLTKNIVMGDVYDTHGNPLVFINEADGSVQYRHDKAYSNTIGFYLSNKNKHLLLANFQRDLFHSNGSTNKGRNLFLTLDAEVQEAAYNLIHTGIQEKASITVLDAKTGAVIAMANNPSFSMQEVMEIAARDGNWKEEVLGGKTSLLSPLTAPTRPGSIYKIVTSIGILENNMEHTVIDDNGKGVYEMDGFTIQNSGKAAYGALTFHKALVKSSNIYFGRMAYEHLGWETFREISKRCKVGTVQIFDFGEVHSTYSSELDPLDESRPNVKLARGGYGYADLQLTTLHAAMITQGIANDGIMCSPYMLQSIHETDGYEVEEGIYKYRVGDEVESVSNYSYTKDEKTTITTPENADKITAAMLDVYESRQASSSVEGVESGGIVVNGEKYSVAMKTGTADLDTEKKDFNNIWMVSFAPANNPQYVVVVNRYGVTGGFGSHLFDDVMKMYQVLFD